MRRKDRRHTHQVELRDAGAPGRPVEVRYLLAVFADALGEKDLLRDVRVAHRASRTPLTCSPGTHNLRSRRKAISSVDAGEQLPRLDRLPGGDVDLGDGARARGLARVPHLHRLAPEDALPALNGRPLPG